MKTVQAVARYFPEKCGGIQIRLSELLPVLQDVYGIESKIAAAQSRPLSSAPMDSEMQSIPSTSSQRTRSSNVSVNSRPSTDLPARDANV